MPKVEKLINLLFSLIDVFDIRSSDPVLAALKHAQRGIVVSSLAMVLALCWMIAMAPDDTVPPATSPLALVHTIHQWLHIVGAIMLISASLSTLFQIGRYIAVAKWPERFVDFSPLDHH